MMEPIILTNESSDHKRKSKNKNKKKKTQPLIENSCSFEILEALIAEDDLEKRTKALNELQAFVLEKKPQYRQLEGEMMTNINNYYNNLVRTRIQTLGDFIRKFLEIYRQARANKLDPLISDLFLKINQRVKKSFAESFDESLKQIGLEFWIDVDGLNLESYLNTFGIENDINPEDMLSQIDIDNQEKLIENVHYIHTLGLHRHFDIPDIVRKLIQTKQMPLLNTFIKSSGYQNVAVNELTAAGNITKAADYVKDFNLNPNEFPELMKALQQSCVRHFSATEHWTRIEERFSKQKRVLAYYVEDLIKQENKYDIALSIIKRNDLLEFLEPETLNEIEPYLRNLNETFQTVVNELYVTDGYGPTEEVLGKEQIGSYWSLKEFGVSVDHDVVIINDSETEIFEEAVKDILSSEEIGLDTEFTLAVTKFDVSKLALLQLANHKRIYLFDCISLNEAPRYHRFIKEFLLNPNIVKVGHSLIQDLKKIQESYAENDELVVINHADVSKMFLQLNSESRYSSLSHICEVILNKKMSKFEQNSNWSRRPLRKAQIHYAAFDAYVLLKIYDELKTKAQEIERIRREEFKENEAHEKMKVEEEIEETMSEETHKINDGNEVQNDDECNKRSLMKEEEEEFR